MANLHFFGNHETDTNVHKANKVYFIIDTGKTLVVLDE